MPALSNTLPDGTFVEAVARLVHPEAKIVDLFGNKTKIAIFNGKDAKPEIYDNPALILPATMMLTTLSGVVDFVNNFAQIVGDEKDAERPSYIVRVDSPTRVSVVVPYIGENNQTLVYAVAEPILPPMKFGQWLSPEEFLIFTMSAFVDTAERKDLQLSMGSIKTGIIGNVEDNGLAQAVSTSSGVTRVGKHDINPIVYLTPHRTFHEIEQPTSAFLHRLRQVDGGKDQAPVAEAALIEADGGAWRTEAITSIGVYLREGITNENVVILS